MKELRRGFTTGSCAACASKAACRMLFSRKEISEITIETPGGVEYTARIHYVNINKNAAKCAVLKDGGDDPDVTTGLYIYSEVEIMSTKSEPDPLTDGIIIHIDGGEGVGRVTRSGLDQAVGEAAINSVPRMMIREAVLSEALAAGFSGELKVVISVPGGSETALKTFNPRLGIEGGISILGTTGVEEPMSKQALIDTIETEMKVVRAQGLMDVAVTPGNYGREYMQRAYGYDLDRSVKCSNFIGDAIVLARKTGFKRMLLTGHIGKLIKLSGGITNTHSAEGDCRMELLAASALRAGCDREVCLGILDCVSTEAAICLLKESDKYDKVIEDVFSRIMDTLKRKADGEIEIECIMYSNDHGEIAGSKGAPRLLEIIKRGIR
ncbi:MAG: cobalt-precorrin-5B (C(1))-methyltransferase CbiD [Lachnospiraceae bacterium]|nr:cobalt-precorrin-5B (C(1))-methyltransferase CbiD [Lachnospiraceae bacterium]